MLSAEDLLQINRWAAVPGRWEDAKAWFRSQSRERRRAVLRQTGAMAMQAGSRSVDVGPACSAFHLQSTWTPVVLMSRGLLRVQLAKVLGLPEDEMSRAFALLLGLLGVADARRRSAECAGGCSHWWHRDLEDEKVRRSILDSGEAGAGSTRERAGPREDSCEEN